MTGKEFLTYNAWPISEIEPLIAKKKTIKFVNSLTLISQKMKELVLFWATIILGHGPSYLCLTIINSHTQFACCCDNDLVSSLPLAKKRLVYAVLESAICICDGILE